MFSASAKSLKGGAGRADYKTGIILPNKIINAARNYAAKNILFP